MIASDFAGVQSRMAVAAQQIDNGDYRFKVARVDTPTMRTVCSIGTREIAVVAEVIKLMLRGHRSYERYIGENMRADVLVALGQEKCSVPGRKQTGLPYPARAEIRAMSRDWPLFIDLRPETVNRVTPASTRGWEYDIRTPMFPPPLVVHGAPATLCARLGTQSDGACLIHASIVTPNGVT